MVTDAYPREFAGWITGLVLKAIATLQALQMNLGSLDKRRALMLHSSIR